MIRSIECYENSDKKFKNIYTDHRFFVKFKLKLCYFMTIWFSVIFRITYQISE